MSFKINKFSIPELRKLAYSFFPDLSWEDIINMSLPTLRLQVESELKKSSSLFNEFSISELKIIAYDFTPEATWEDISSLSLGALESLVRDIFAESPSIDPLGLTEENFELCVCMKHMPTRKKKANRAEKYRKAPKYRKNVKGGSPMVKHTRKRVSEDDITNRSYCDKASRCYVSCRKIH